MCQRSRLEWEFPSKSDLWRHEFAPLFRGLTGLKREKYRWHQGLLVHLAESRSSSSYLLSCLTGQVLKDGVLSSFALLYQGHLQFGTLTSFVGFRLGANNT